MKVNISLHCVIKMGISHSIKLLSVDILQVYIVKFSLMACQEFILVIWVFFFLHCFLFMVTLFRALISSTFCFLIAASFDVLFE